MVHIFKQSLRYRNRWFPAILLLMLVMGSTGAVFLYFKEKDILLLLSPIINIFGIWLLLKRYYFLYVFINIWLILIMLNVFFQILPFLLNAGSLEVIPSCIIKTVIVIVLYICKKKYIYSINDDQTVIVRPFIRRLVKLIQIHPVVVTFTAATLNFVLFFLLFIVSDFFPAFHGSVQHVIFMLIAYMLLVAMILFTIFSYINKKRKGSLGDLSKILYFVFKPAIGGAFLALFIWVKSPFSLPPFCDVDYFDPAVWLDNSTIEKVVFPSPRQKMIMDLVRNILPGKNRVQIESFLGKPFVFDRGSWNFKNEKLLYFYQFGKEQGSFSPAKRPAWLVIRFNNNGDYKFSCILYDADDLLAKLIIQVP